MSQFIEFKSSFGTFTVNTSLIASITDSRGLNEEFPTTVRFTQEITVGDGSFVRDVDFAVVTDSYESLSRLLLNDENRHTP